ncbi:MAG: hypothetical protein IJS69_06970 [Selenomonadaceae bacterium]|nr:hypothetical protein [Selenomonadaceae bacterium]
MAGVIEELKERIILESMINVAKELISIGKMTLEEIAAICKLPLEKVQELASKKTVNDLK